MGFTGNPAPPGISQVTGSQNTLFTTSSTDAVSVVAGANQTISVTFNSNDGLPITGFGVLENVAMLPPGWSGPGRFTCASVSTGNGCVLNLTYSPVAAGSGVLSLDCVFIDNAAMPVTPGRCLDIAYTSTAHDNVIASISPTGQIIAAPNSGSESVIVNFVTDDGQAATSFSLTNNLAALPAGWTSAATGLACAAVSTGSGCQLALTFAPAAPTRGTLTLSYGYTDHSGAAKTGAVNIPYSTAAHNSVVASTAPTGQITAAITGSAQTVPITFTTNDGKSARSLALMSDLSRLPPGWRSAASSFSCASVSTGNGCQLPLTYQPAALGSGTLTLNYSYSDSYGAAATGMLNFAYAATTDDNVVGTASPSGQINAIVGAGSQTLTVTFTTDDSRQATGLRLISSLAAIPAGWSSGSGAFACDAFSVGGSCQLALVYAPSAAAAGTLTLQYSYVNNAGAVKTGTLNVPYRATADDNVVGTPSQSSIAVQVGSNATVDIDFTTDDPPNVATLMSVTSGLTMLPAGWSSTSNAFACATVGIGTVCKLQLTYTPTVVDAGSLSVGFSYLNNSLIAKTGTATITYIATP